MITAFFLIVFASLVSFGVGFLCGVQNANSSKVAKAKSIVEEIRK